MCEQRCQLCQYWKPYTDKKQGRCGVPLAVGEAVIAAVSNEPELPGEMPDEMWRHLNGDRDATEQAMRIVVNQTKYNIIAAIRAQAAKETSRRVASHH